MKFKGSLFTSFVTEADKQPPQFTFTKNQIIFPKNTIVKFDKETIKDFDYYTLNAKGNIDIRYRYEITAGNEKPLRLFVSKWNERKLKWIHGLYPFQKDATAATILSIVAIIISLILGLIGLKCK